MANGLRNEGFLDEADKQWLQIANANGNAAYTDPTTVVTDCYNSENPGARSWFKAESTQLLDMTAAYLDLLDRHNIPWMALRTRSPGRLVYEDEVQVVAVPHPYSDHWPFQPSPIEIEVRGGLSEKSMKTTISERTIFEDIFARSTEDWVSDGEIHSLVMTRTGEADPATTRSMALGVIVELIMRDWMIPTTYNTPWNVDPWEAVRRIDGAWRKCKDRIGYLDVAQFVPTPKALEMGRAVLRREGWDV